MDINFFKDNNLEIKKALLAKNLQLDLDEIEKLDQKRKKLQLEVDNLRSQKNSLTRKLGKNAQPQVIKIKQSLKQLEPKLKDTLSKIQALLDKIPNLPKADVPVGKDESQNIIIKKWGRPPIFDFQPKDHIHLGKSLDLIDLEKASQISGSRFYYLKNEAVLLEFALINFATKFLVEERFTPLLPPVLIKPSSMRPMGYLEHGEDNEVYHLEKDDLYLIGTSEQSIGPYHQNETIEAKKLPLRYFAFSTCFRREAGSYGKDIKGIIRVHQFDKLEMFSFTLPGQSDKEHEYLLSLEEKLMQKLKIPYQVVKMCTGDLGLTAARKYDIEAWLPSQQKYRETHSTSTCTDYQSRRLNIRYRKDNKKGFIHTLNGTALAIPRILIAILENNQQKDGTIQVPEKLVEYTGFEKIKPKK